MRASLPSLAKAKKTTMQPAITALCENKKLTIKIKAP
jgi:hypothetical protein